MKSKILIIDDEIMICEVIKEYGEEFEGYSVDYALNSEQAIEHLSSNVYDAITLDIQLGAEDGFDVLKIIKEKTTCPVIFVSAVHESKIVVDGLELGAEDYVKKPFDFTELFTRIKKIIERSRLTKALNNEYKISDYTINETREEIFKDGNKIEIVGMPYKILVYMLKNVNKTVTRDEFFRELWGGDYEFSSRVIDAHIKAVRNSTMDYRIKSVRGKGYKFEINEEKE